MWNGWELCDEVADTAGEYLLQCHISLTFLGFFRSLNPLGRLLDVPEDVLAFELNISYHGEPNFRFFYLFFTVHLMSLHFPRNTFSNRLSNVCIMFMADTWRCGVPAG